MTISGSLHGSTSTDAINQEQRYSRVGEVYRPRIEKLQAEEKGRELGDRTLHSLLVRKLPDRQPENYSRWLIERARKKSAF